MAIKKKGSGDTEQRTLIAVLLCMVLYTVYTAFFAPQAPPVDPAPVEVVGEGTTVDPVAEPIVPPAPVETLEHTERPWSSDVVSGTFSSTDGTLTDLIIPEQPGPLAITPIWDHALNLIKGEEGEWKPYGDEPGPQRLVGERGSLLMAGAGPAFVDGEYSVSGGEVITATRHSGGLTVQKTWKLDEDPRFLDVELRFANSGSSDIAGPLWFGSADAYDEMGGMMSRYSNFSWPFGHADGDLEQPSKLEDLDEDGPSVHEGAVTWYGTGDRYFVAMTLLPEEHQGWGDLVFAPTEDGRHGVFVVHPGGLASGDSQTVTLRIYTGARDISVLEDLGPTLDDAVDLGFFGFFARLLLTGLKLIEGVVGNWGWSIMLLTFFINIAFWPLMKKSYESGQKMRALQPKIDAMKARFKDDPQRQGQEQMKLFQEEGVNPLGGCLPMLLRMPVLFALYSVLLYSVDVYHADWLYLKDLSVADPTAMLPLFVGIMMFIQQRLTPMPANMDATQAKMMRLMPFMFVAFMFVFPAGLALYVCVNTTMSILQMWLVKRKYPTPPAPAAAK